MPAGFQPQSVKQHANELRGLREPGLTKTASALDVIDAAFNQVYSAIVSLQSSNSSAAAPMSSVVVTGTVDGTNATFTIPAAPVNGVLVFVEGGLQAQGTDSLTGDYSIAGNTITFNAQSVPRAGARILVYTW